MTQGMGGLKNGLYNLRAEFKVYVDQELPNRLELS